ncbi:MAG: phosphoribosylglycinamide formyltransferase [Flexistipes sinusarabici]|uniref:Phosphoribosylglycinamide formyltransferase n=1 Tax=Flexistipes sinusarabici TaxID=2352 RepID=A0A5D0MQ87_FLESI|nr:phosphoribosylglycinamide formyltransferase [Flexistipes sinusarabici]TYB32889.1 MAG: phosphoribosylglycinamide formyltransferase [Flexistipes sinusarabici]
MKNIAVLLSGRGSNFKAIYNSIEAGYIVNARIKAVVSNKAEAPGLQFAKDRCLSSYFVNPSEFESRTAYDTEIIDILKSKGIDLVCLAGYMRLLSAKFVDTFKNRIMNIHPSLLPAFPGLNAQKQALEYGVKISGCTVHFVDKELDHGPIILQKAVEIKGNDTVKDVSERILIEEHKIYPEAVRLFVENRLTVNNRKVSIDYS